MRSRPWTAWSPEAGARAHPRALGPPAITPVFFRAAFSAERRRQGLEAAQHRPQALPIVENWTFRFQQVGLHPQQHAVGHEDEGIVVIDLHRLLGPQHILAVDDGDLVAVDDAGAEVQDRVVALDGDLASFPS